MNQDQITVDISREEGVWNAECADDPSINAEGAESLDRICADLDDQVGDRGGDTNATVRYRICPWEKAGCSIVFEVMGAEGDYRARNAERDDQTVDGTTLDELVTAIESAGVDTSHTMLTWDRDMEDLDAIRETM